MMTHGTLVHVPSAHEADHHPADPNPATTFQFFFAADAINSTLLSFSSNSFQSADDEQTMSTSNVERFRTTGTDRADTQGRGNCSGCARGGASTVEVSVFAIKRNQLIHWPTFK